MGNITTDAWKRDLLKELDGFRLDVNGWLKLDQALDRALDRIYRSCVPGHADCDEAIRENHELMVRYRTAINDALEVKGIGTDNLQASSTMASVLRAALRDD